MNRKKIYLRLMAVLSGLSGLTLLGFVFYPLVEYQINSPRFASYLSPIPEEVLASVNQNGGNDLTKASNWFVGTDQKLFESPSILYYTLSIPQLNIRNAAVSIGGEDLSQSLIQYPGTAVPGKFGNAVIFGHSVLPQFFNPKNYLSIFSTLPKLRRGDDVYIDYDGVSYHYRVEDAFEVLPTDIQILQQNPTDSFLSLVTCTPPGNPLRPRRLIVRARIVDER